MFFTNPRGGLQKRPMIFDGHEPADYADQRRFGIDADLRAQNAGPSLYSEESIEVQPQLNDANLVRGRYLSPYQFVFQPPGDRNDRVAQPPQQAFEEDEHSRQDRPEVSVKHVPMKSVHDHGHAGQSRREASGKPGFGCVRVDHVRASLSHPAPQHHRRPEVVPHRDSPSQGRDSYGPHSVTRRKLEHVALGWPFLAHDQRRLESRWIESRRDQDDVDRGSPDVEAGEDAGHAYSRRHSSSWCGHRGSGFPSSTE